MRLYAKIFLCGTTIFAAAFLTAGYLLLASVYQNDIEREKEIAWTQFQYDKFSVQSQIIWEKRDLALGWVEDTPFLERLMLMIGRGTAFYMDEEREIISDLPDGMESASLLKGAGDGKVRYQFQKIGAKTYLLTAGKITYDGTDLYMLRGHDITQMEDRNRQLLERFCGMYAAAMAAGMATLLFASAFITRAVNKMAWMAERIAQGDYGSRLDVHGRDEIAELAASFNTMTDSIEEKIQGLSEAVRQKEEFVANFSHELKTPLTSVIGYADMLYQRDLPPQEVKEAAWYIVNEGMRLEALSFKLMDLFVLGRQDFVLEEMPAQEVFAHIFDGMDPVLRERGAILRAEIEDSYIQVEIDLLKTLIWNLVDNASKANSTDIRLKGIQVETGRYLVEVSDNGCGIAQEEIGKIMEAFYMVDKSRARKLHGAGLGLTLAGEIARIHGSELKIQSALGVGTTISLELQGAKQDARKESAQDGIQGSAKEECEHTRRGKCREAGKQ